MNTRFFFVIVLVAMIVQLLLVEGLAPVGGVRIGKDITKSVILAGICFMTDVVGDFENEGSDKFSGVLCLNEMADFNHDEFLVEEQDFSGSWCYFKRSVYRLKPVGMVAASERGERMGYCCLMRSKSSCIGYGSVILKKLVFKRRRWPCVDRAGEDILARLSIC